VVDPLGGLLVSVALLALLNVTTGANIYSFHTLYGNRLTRCYLGASRAKGGAAVPEERPSFPGGAPTGVGGRFRRENPATGFDPDDDLALAKLHPANSYRGPYPLFNTALQLVAGDRLAWQDRKAASFTLAPGHYRCPVTGWAPTPDDPPGGKSSFSVGRAMTTSGAAVDPSMANHQSAPLTAFLTVFNARTGIWVRNPRYHDGTTLDRPTNLGFGLPVGLTLELLGQTDERTRHVHLSDGGASRTSGCTS
jgi:hypothetical protein